MHAGRFGHAPGSAKPSANAIDVMNMVRRSKKLPPSTGCSLPDHTANAAMQLYRRTITPASGGPGLR